ncbi:MAG: winged helix-turn-helix domain-containing protein [Planctomycetes bacterium]|nr:winged helix-turn-helix domain-containing protein [Planctomycetota bacterium]
MGTFVEADADLPLVRLCRRNDPPTSHEAAARARTFKGEHRLRILEALADGPAGQSEISRRTGLSIAAVSKRLSEMRRDGDIERCGECRSASGGREGAYRRATHGR